MFIKEFSEKLQNMNFRVKCFAALIAAFFAISAGFAFPVSSCRRQEVVSDNHRKPMPLNRIIGEGECMVSVRVENTSGFVLDSVDSVAIVDIIAADSSGNTPVVARHGRLLSVSRIQEKQDGNIHYVMTVVVKKEDALRILKVQDRMSFSVIVHSESSGKILKGGDYDGERFMYSPEIIEDGGGEF